MIDNLEQKHSLQIILKAEDGYHIENFEIIEE